MQEAGLISGVAEPGCDFFPAPGCLPTEDLGEIREKWDRALSFGPGKRVAPTLPQPPPVFTHRSPNSQPRGTLCLRHQPPGATRKPLPSRRFHPHWVENRASGILELSRSPRAGREAPAPLPGRLQSSQARWPGGCVLRKGGVGEGLRGLRKSRARLRLDEGRAAASSMGGGRARDSAKPPALLPPLTQAMVALGEGRLQLHSAQAEGGRKVSSVE